MTQHEGPEHQMLSVIDHRAANSQDQVARDRNHRPEPDRDESSGALFSLYQDMTEEDDKQRVKRWQKDADGILVFAGLLTVAVVTLLTVTIPELKDDPQATSAFYLKQLFELQLNTDNNRSSPFIPDQPPSSRSSTFIITNGVLFICLSLNLFAAMLALLLQQWTRQYTMITHSLRSSSDIRARVRESYGGSPQKSPIFLAIRVSMASLLLSLIIFILAICFYLFRLNQPVYLCFYICSALCFDIGIVISIHVSRSLSVESTLASRLLLRLVPQKCVRIAQKSTMEIEDRILDHVCGALRPENSDLVRLGKAKLKMATKNLIERTLSSNSLSDSDKTRRVVACVEFADSVRLSDVASSILQVILARDQRQLLTLVEIGRSLRNRRWSGLCAQSLIAGIISNVQSGDQDWIALAADQLRKSEDVIRGYLEHGQENLLLANLTYITRKIFESSSGDDQDRDMASASSLILPTLSKFDIQNILPGLRNDFCVLWDEINRKAPNDRVLTKIRNDLIFVHHHLTPLPPGWDIQCTSQGRVYYVDHNTHSTTYTHPSSHIAGGLPPSASASSQVPSCPTPLGAGHDSGAPDDSIEMRSLNHTVNVPIN